MPRVTIYPAYSATSELYPFVLDAPEACTATKIKRAVGCDDASWLFVKLPRHSYDAKCECYSCKHDKRGWWIRPPWVHRERWNSAPWHRWIRTDIQARNVRLKLRGGEHFVIVATVDVPTFLSQMSDFRKPHGMLMALSSYAALYGIKNPTKEADEPEETPQDRRDRIGREVCAGW